MAAMGNPGAALPEAPRPHPLEVAAGLVFRDSRLLITQRRPGDDFGGFWEFPGGKREAGESFEDCLRRELMEELGIEVLVGSLVETAGHVSTARYIRLQFYQCRWLRHEPRPLGCHDLRWVTLHELGRHEFPFPPADGRMIERLKTQPALWTLDQSGP